MKKLGLALLLVVCWAATASAARVYLKDGSWIDAKRVWREKGQVVVLVNKQSITTFNNSEINLKKTFPPRKKKVKPVEVTAPATPVSTGAPAAAGTAQATAQPTKEGKKIALPSLPNKLPEREPPSVGGEGTIRKQKKEMEQRLNE